MAVIRSANSLADNQSVLLVGSIAGLLCMIVAVLGIKLRWFKHRMTFDGVPTESPARRSRHEDLAAEPQIVRATFRTGNDFDSFVDYSPPAVLPPVRINNKRPPVRPLRKLAPSPPVEGQTSSDAEPFLRLKAVPSEPPTRAPPLPLTPPPSEQTSFEDNFALASPTLTADMYSLDRGAIPDLDFGEGPENLDQLTTEAMSPTYAVVHKKKTVVENDDHNMIAVELPQIPAVAVTQKPLPAPPPYVEIEDKPEEHFTRFKKIKRPPISNVTETNHQLLKADPMPPPRRATQQLAEPIYIVPETTGTLEMPSQRTSSHQLTIEQLVAGEPIYVVPIKTPPVTTGMQEISKKNAFLFQVATPAAVPNLKPIRPPSPVTYNPSISPQIQPQASPLSSRSIFSFILPKTAKAPPQSEQPSPFTSMPDLRAEVPPDVHSALPRNASASSLTQSPLAVLPASSTGGQKEVNGRAKSSIFSFLKGGNKTEATPPSTEIIVPPKKETKKKMKTIRVLKEPKKPAIDVTKIKPALRNPLNRSESVEKSSKPNASVKFAELPTNVRFADASSEDESSDVKNGPLVDSEPPVPRQRTILNLEPAISPPPVRNGRMKVQSSSDDDDAPDDTWNMLAQHRMNTQNMVQAQAAAKQRQPAANQRPRADIAQQQRQIELINKPKTMREMRKDQEEKRGKEIRLEGDGGRRNVESDTEA